MAATAGNGNNAASIKETPVLLLDRGREEQPVPVQLRLTQALQTSLELNTLLDIFFQNLQALVPVGGLTYTNEAAHCHVVIGIQSMQTLSYQIKGSSQDLGEITVTRPKRFSRKEMSHIENLLSSLIFPLRNALLYREAVMSSLMDNLTGLGNRSALFKALSRETSLARRHCQPLSILVIDIDHFKNINDTYGHAAGDDALRQLGKAIRAIARETDQSFRYGGEEFVLLLDKTDQKGARVIAERLRHRIEQLKVSSEGHLFRITASIGVGTLTNEDDDDSLFQRADKALYRAKKEGRNRVSVAR